MASVISLNKRILLIRTIGNFLVLGSFVGLIFTFYPIMSVFAKHNLDKVRGREYQAAPVASSATQSFGSLLGRDDPNLKILTPKDPNFSIIVEKIGADAPIIANVDPGNKDVYSAALRRGVAHSLGSSFPGQSGVTYLFAHSTDSIFNVPRFNAIFYLLSELEIGDRLVLFFNNKRFDYIVQETKITEPEDVSYFTMQTEEQILVLQTCYPPGTTWKRFLVIAKPAASVTTVSSVQ